jgi:hypothetical protein
MPAKGPGAEQIIPAQRPSVCRNDDAESSRPNDASKLTVGTEIRYICDVCGDGNADATFTDKYGEPRWLIGCKSAKCAAMNGSWLCAQAEALGLEASAPKEAIASALMARDGQPARSGRREVDELPSQASFDGWSSALRAGGYPRAYAYLTEERGIDPDTLDFWNVGYSDTRKFGPYPTTPAFMFPVRDRAGQLVGVKLRPWPRRTIPRSGKAIKSLNLRGVPAALYPAPTEGRGALIVCEGEIDALLLWQEGYSVVTSTCGTSWNPAWDAQQLAGRCVAFIYDVGEESMERARAQARRAMEEGGAREAWAVDMSMAAGMEAPGSDVADFLDIYPPERLRSIIRLSRRMELGLPWRTEEFLIGSGDAITASSARPPIRGERRAARVARSNGLVVRSADLSRTREFKWAWEQRILIGYLNLVIGEEGIGKGNLAAWIAARITRGELPGNLHGKPRSITLIGDEDSWDHIWTPRLHSAGADLARTTYIEAGSNGIFEVRRDADALLDYVKDSRIALVFFDQLLDNLGYTDSWKDKEVRDALAPMRRVAASSSAAMLASMHPNKKSGGTFRNRISGTSAFNALSRSSLYALAHPHLPDRCVVVRAKGNYSVEPDAFEFCIEGQTLRHGARVIETSRIAAARESELRVSDLLNTETSRREDDSRGARAERLLAELFGDGEERKATDVIERIRDEHGITKRTLSAAAREVGLRIEKRGFPAVVYWQRPREATRDAG